VWVGVYARACGVEQVKQGVDDGLFLICTCAYIHTYIYICIYMNVFIHMCMHACMYVCIFVFAGAVVWV